jgi:hypothetical protein
LRRGRAAELKFTFDQDLTLDTAAMRPVKRKVIRITHGPLPDTLPQIMSDGRCTPERMQVDTVVLEALAQATGSSVVLNGPTTLRFCLSTN